jgi:hypothetical protein
MGRLRELMKARYLVIDCKVDRPHPAFPGEIGVDVTLKRVHSAYNETIVINMRPSDMKELDLCYNSVVELEIKCVS